MCTFNLWHRNRSFLLAFLSYTKRNCSFMEAWLSAARNKKGPFALLDFQILHIFPCQTHLFKKMTLADICKQTTAHRTKMVWHCPLQHLNRDQETLKQSNWWSVIYIRYINLINGCCLCQFTNLFLLTP